MEEENDLNMMSKNYASQMDKPKNPYDLPQTSIGMKKRELIYIFWFESVGTFVLTFATYASNNNGFVIACMYGVLLMLAQNQKCTFNPAITFMLGLRDKATWITVAILSQFFGAIIAGLIGYFSFSSVYKIIIDENIDTNNAAYLQAFADSSMLPNALGEVLGAGVLTMGIIFQYDELLDFTNNRLDHSVIVASLYAFGRALTYKSQSSLNPAVALSMEFFESIKDGRWGRFAFVWIFTVGPFIGALSAQFFVKVIYKPCFEKQIKLGLKF